MDYLSLLEPLLEEYNSVKSRAALQVEYTVPLKPNDLRGLLLPVSTSSIMKAFVC